MKMRCTIVHTKLARATNPNNVNPSDAIVFFSQSSCLVPTQPYSQKTSICMLLRTSRTNLPALAFRVKTLRTAPLTSRWTYAPTPTHLPRIISRSHISMSKKVRHLITPGDSNLNNHYQRFVSSWAVWLFDVKTLQLATQAWPLV